MATLSYSEIQEFLDKTDFSSLAPYHISILRNIMVEPIQPYLRFFACQSGFNLKIKFGEYDNIFQEAIGGRNDLLGKDTHCVMIFMNLDVLSNVLSRNFTSLNKQQLCLETDRIKEYIKTVLQGIRSHTNAMILWHGFELPVYPAFGIWDSQIEDGQTGFIGGLNKFLREQLRKIPHAYFVNLNLCLSRLGSKNYYDVRYWHIARAPYSREALREIASEDFKFIRSAMGKNKKAIVLDCDGTLWGGIIGEDGIEGIQLGKTHPGSSFFEFQQEIVNLYNRGVIIAICSKNNADDVWEVFQKHPDMAIKEEHIATAQINWRDKAVNLRQIAQDLNIGLDSLVFVDDSEFEVNLIRQVLPEVEVIYMPPSKVVEYRDILASCGLFDTLAFSAEDKKRGAMYKAEVARKKLQVQATDMETYYKSLEMELEIRLADEFSIPRIAQLTQRTNQFNVTTKRYSEADIKNFANGDGADVIYVRLKDRFGDSGIVGVCILEYKNRNAIFDTFLLSCRVLGRGVEDAFLIQALKLAKKRGCKVAIGVYSTTRKNGQAENFYTAQGFVKFEDNQNMTVGRYRYKLKGGVQPEPNFFKEIVSEIDQRLEIKA